MTTETQFQKASPELLRIFQAMSQTSVAVVVQRDKGGTRTVSLERSPGDIAAMDEKRRISMSLEIQSPKIRPASWETQN